jgi:hypothetical protein
MVIKSGTVISRRTLVVAAGLGSGLALVRPSVLFAAECEIP